MLYDAEFLKALDECREKITYARVISLDMDENPIEQVEGRITSGSVNVDGNSAVRRTCSLTMVSQDVNINDYYWGLNTKFKLEVGVENKVSRKDFYPNYPDIIWFKMGTYIITQISTSLGTNNFTMSLQGKDKMCLLNGDVGGVINATTDFGTYDFYDTETGITSNYKLPIKDILWDGVHAYANEPFSNIVLNDLDEMGLELLEYRYDTPLYLIRQSISDEYQMITVEDIPISNASDGATKLSSITVYDNLTSSMLGDERPVTTFDFNGYTCCVAKVEYGQTAGYRTCDLVYAGDLIANVGESFTSVLDKIKSMLGEFEYFYDLDGRFIFQRKKSLVNTVWTPQKRDGDNQLYVEALALASNSVYNFQGSILISSFQNSPNLMNLKNDFTVWGNRKGISGSDIPIHMRYAIDNKPWRYVLYDQYEGHPVVLTTRSKSEIENDPTLQTQHSKVTDIEMAWKNFKKNQRQDPLMYPGNLQKKDNLWWEIIDWAEYYKILFDEYPGSRHPDDEMRFYCTLLDRTSLLKNSHEEGLQEFTVSGDSGAYTNTVEVYFYEKDGIKSVRLSMHGGCTHTYAQFLDLEFFINSGFKEEADIDLGEGNIYHFVHQGAYYGNVYWNKDRLLTAQREQGLYHYLCYCYDPQIPESKKQAKLEEIETIETWSDPYLSWPGNIDCYHYGVDWRELIYRMAKDYRRHNHEDNFERQLATLNYPLYPKGLTGYEQYYTDLEGFWRQLYNYPIIEKEKTSLINYTYTFYRDIEDKTDQDNIYIKGCYRPVGIQVKNTPYEKINKTLINQYLYDETDNKYYYKDISKIYYYSTNQGITFSDSFRGSNISDSNFINYCKAGQLYLREIPDINNIYVYKEFGEFRGFYKYLDTLNYTNGKYFEKIINKDLISGVDFIPVTKETPIKTYTEKCGLYITTDNNYLSSLDAAINEKEDLLAVYHAQYLAMLESTSMTDEDRQEIRTLVNECQAELTSLTQQRDTYLINDYENSFALVTNYWQDNLPLTLDNIFVYDDTTLYKMSNIRQLSTLRSVYKGNNVEVPQFITVSTLNNQGQTTIASIKTTCVYYVADSDFYTEEEDNAYWYKGVFDSPQSLNFWFDFLEGDNELRQFTTQAVGDRPKAVNETSVKSIYYRDTPKIIFTTAEKMALEDKKTGYNYFILPDNSNYENMFKISSQGIDAKNRIDELLYQHSYCTESVTISAIPIYYLDVNKRIHVYDPNTGINGDYIVSRLSYPLQYNGMMSLSATKAPENSVTEREE